MNTKFTSYEKQSKKDKKLMDSRERNFWNINPTTKIIPNKKRLKLEKIIKNEERNYSDEI